MCKGMRVAICFFFSSRRRHTRWNCDWSSDVCSSDLYPLPALGAAELAANPPRASSRTVVVAGVSDAIGVALARSHAAPGVRVCLIGGVAQTLSQAAEDCRHRGALVETFCLAGQSQSSLADYLAAFDLAAPVDALVVHAGAAVEPADIQHVERDIGRVMRLVTAIGEPMSRRGR